MSHLEAKSKTFSSRNVHGMLVQVFPLHTVLLQLRVVMGQIIAWRAHFAFFPLLVRLEPPAPQPACLSTGFWRSFLELLDALFEDDDGEEEEHCAQDHLWNEGEAADECGCGRGRETGSSRATDGSSDAFDRQLCIR